MPQGVNAMPSTQSQFCVLSQMAGIRLRVAFRVKDIEFPARLHNNASTQGGNFEIVPVVGPA